MDGNYTTLLKRQQMELSDVYYMTCEASIEGNKREYDLSGAVVKMVLVATLATGAGDFTTETKAMAVHSREIPVSVQTAGNRADRSSQVEIAGEKMSVEVFRMPTYRQDGRKEREALVERLVRTNRMNMLMASFHKNKTFDPIAFNTRITMQATNRALSALPFIDCILQYDKYDDIWQYNLYFEHHLELAVSAYVDDNGMDENVDYSIYHDGDLLIANEMSLPQLVKKMKSVLAKVGKNV